MMLHDRRCKEIIDANPNMLVPWYLMASYMYYQKDNPIISDGLFDEICSRLRGYWKHIRHPDKLVVRRADLMAGTCLLPEGAYPSRAIGAATRLADALKTKQRVRLNEPVSTNTAPIRQTRVRLSASPSRVRLIKEHPRV